MQDTLSSAQSTELVGLWRRRQTLAPDEVEASPAAESRDHSAPSSAFALCAHFRRYLIDCTRASSFRRKLSIGGQVSEAQLEDQLGAHEDPAIVLAEHGLSGTPGMPGVVHRASMEDLLLPLTELARRREAVAQRAFPARWAPGRLVSVVHDRWLLGVLLDKCIGADRWQGWMAAGEIDWAGAFDVLLESGDEPCKPLFGMVQAWSVDVDRGTAALHPRARPRRSAHRIPGAVPRGGGELRRGMPGAGCPMRLA
jgi:hypothetical protein